MPSIHPSEEPQLGWFVPCLAVADLKASLEFYAKLDLVQYGGDIAENWAMVRNRAVELHLFHGHIKRDLPNFRGGNPDEIKAAMSARGLTLHSEAGERSFTYLDPDGREVFFDTGVEEEEAYQSGQPLTGEVPGDVHEGKGMDLGNLTWCLACKDLQATLAFYRTLGLESAGGEPESGWAILGRADHPPKFGTRLVTTCISLFQDMIPADMLNFRGCNVASIAATLEERGLKLVEGVTIGEDGGESLFIADPDGRPVFFDTTPPERLY